VIDPGRLARDVSALVQVPSVTGDERAALERLAELAGALCLEAELVTHDLAALRVLPGHPSEEAPRNALHGVVIRRPGPPDGPRICLDGHVDVVAPGAGPWSDDPWSGRIAAGRVFGRGSVDMKGGVVAALHGLAASADAPGGEVVLLGVAAEEDGGLGTFAALEADARFDAALIPEPTGFDVVCAQAGALTFTGTVPGRAAHAAMRLEGVSAIDRYMAVHAALAAHETRINAGVDHPLMRELALPYPVSVGRIEAGEWSSTVPDRLTFEGRVGVRIGESVADARAALAAAVGGAAGDVELMWTGGQFGPGETDASDPWVERVRAAAAGALGRPVPAAGVPYGADLRLFCERGIPCVMFGPPGLERAHAIDEYVEIADLVVVAETVAAALRTTLTA
jgi:acetylornithine deacetylase